LFTLTASAETAGRLPSDRWFTAFQDPCLAVGEVHKIAPPVPKKEKSRLSAGPPCPTRYRREGRLALSARFLLLLTGLLLPAALLAGLLLSWVLVLLARILILIAHSEFSLCIVSSQD
jgi:hypothetical protein